MLKFANLFKWNPKLRSRTSSLGARSSHLGLVALCLFLPAYAEHESHAHTNPLWSIFIESDLLNILILAGAIIYLGSRILPKMSDERKKQIQKELDLAKESRIQAEKELTSIREKCKNLDKEIANMLQEAKNTSSLIQKRTEEETESEIENLKIKFKKEIEQIKEETQNSIRKTISESALKLAEETLIKISENPNVQQKLIDDFLEELDSPSRN